MAFGYSGGVGQALRRHGLDAPEAARIMGYKGPGMVYKILRDENAPSLDALQRLADHINEPIGDLLPNSGRAVFSDEFRDVLASISGIAGDDREDILSALAVNARVLANAFLRRPAAVPFVKPGIVVAMPERTVPTATPEFPVDPAQFDEAASDTDYPLFLHGYEMEDFEAAAGGAGIENSDMGTTVLNSREVRDETVRIVKVRGDSMSPTFEAGWKLAVDVTATTPQNGDVVLLQRENGTLLGRWHAERGRTLLAKDNEEYEAVLLTNEDRVIGIVSHVAWQPVKRIAAMTARLPKGRKR